VSLSLASTLISTPAAPLSLLHAARAVRAGRGAGAGERRWSAGAGSGLAVQARWSGLRCGGARAEEGGCGSCGAGAGGPERAAARRWLGVVPHGDSTGERTARVKTWRWPAPSLRGGSGPRRRRRKRAEAAQRRRLGPPPSRASGTAGRG
jgi:hypothetical protein